MEGFPPAGEYFMSVSLMANVPYQLVIWGIIYVVKGNGQFHHSKAGSKMTTMYTHHIDDVLPQFFTNLVQSGPVDFSKVLGNLDGF
jgi:hypothetical protein